MQLVASEIKGLDEIFLLAGSYWNRWLNLSNMSHVAMRKEYAQFDEYESSWAGDSPNQFSVVKFLPSCLLINRDAGSGCFKHARFLPSLFLSKHGLKPN